MVFLNNTCFLSILRLTVKVFGCFDFWILVGLLVLYFCLVKWFFLLAYGYWIPSIGWSSGRLNCRRGANIIVFYLNDFLSWPSAIEFLQLVGLLGASIAGAGASYFLLDQKVGKKSRPVQPVGWSPLKRLSAAGRAPSSLPGLTKPLRLFTNLHAERAGVFLFYGDLGVRIVFFLFLSLRLLNFFNWLMFRASQSPARG